MSTYSKDKKSLVSLQRETQSIGEIVKELRFLSSEASSVSAVYTARFYGVPLTKLSQFSILRVSTLCRKKKKGGKLWGKINLKAWRCASAPIPSDDIGRFPILQPRGITALTLRSLYLCDQGLDTDTRSCVLELLLA